MSLGRFATMVITPESTHLADAPTVRRYAHSVQPAKKTTHTMNNTHAHTLEKHHYT